MPTPEARQSAALAKQALADAVADIVDKVRGVLSALDPLDVLVIGHDLAEGLGKINREGAATMLPLVLGSRVLYAGAGRRKAVAALKKMMPAETFEAIVAESKRG